MAPTGNSFPSDLVVNLVFGISATLISGVTIYQGHKLWVLWKHAEGSSGAYVSTPDTSRALTYVMRRHEQRRFNDIEASSQALLLILPHAGIDLVEALPSTGPTRSNDGPPGLEDTGSGTRTLDHDGAT